MRHADIAIIGGGLAGSTAATMLGRAGIDTVLIDGHKAYPKDFRCEKLDGSQVELVRKTGLLDAVTRVSTPDLEVWVARFGRIVEKKASAQLDILYQDLVNTIRAEIPQSVSFIQGKAAGITTGPERQHITLASGEEISARLIVLANGLNIGLRHSVGIERQVISPSHSISIGFDLEPVGRASFDFRALTYYTEATHTRAAYVTFFPIGPVMRANLFVYRDMDDPWLREMRHDGGRALFTLFPRLRALTGEAGVHDVKIRPVDLYVSKGHRQGGIVLVGDAFATSCPAAGTGCNKVFTDVERLCKVHIPRWLATPGMDKEKVAQFYDDEVKVACDTFAAAKAFYLRSLSIETAPGWHARRWLKFLGHAGKGALRALRERPALPALDRAGAPAGGSAG